MDCGHLLCAESRRNEETHPISAKVKVKQISQKVDNK